MDSVLSARTNFFLYNISHWNKPTAFSKSLTVAQSETVCPNEGVMRLNPLAIVRAQARCSSYSPVTLKFY